MLSEENLPENIEENSSNFKDIFRELHSDKEFNHLYNEALEKRAPLDKNFSRRKFLALLGIPAAFAATGCSNYRDKGNIVPYNKKPSEITIGNPVFYASTCNVCSNSCGILIKTREGRPIKIDGNPDHPINSGKICTTGQVSILSLYDPQRIKEPIFNNTQISWQEADKKIIQTLIKTTENGKEIALITNGITSPTYKKLIEDFIKTFPSTKIYSYEITGYTNKINAFKKTYGRESLPSEDFENAKIIVSFECDFLNNYPNKLSVLNKFSKNREIIEKEKFNRTYCFESTPTVTGINSDYRIVLRSDILEEFICCLINEFLTVKKLSEYAKNINVINPFSRYILSDFIPKNNLSKNVIDNLINDLSNNTGKSLILGGIQLSESTQILIFFLNKILENDKLYSKDKEIKCQYPLIKKADFNNLVEKINNDKIEVLIHIDTNPVYHFNGIFDYIKAIEKVPLVITLSEFESETSAQSHYTLPINNYLESWGDYNYVTGIYSLQQPVISPIYNTRQKEEILLTWIEGTHQNNSYLRYLKNNWEKNLLPAFGFPFDFKSFWINSLNAGVVKTNEKINFTGEFKIESLGLSNKPTSVTANDYVLIIKENPFLLDGKYANNGWLQEIPHPVSKIVWDNYATISPSAAKNLSLNTGDIIEIKKSGKSIKIPVLIQPGNADKVISVELGYGRSKAGIIGSFIGTNPICLLNADKDDLIIKDIEIVKTGDTYELVSTQEHYSLEKYKDIPIKRNIIYEFELDEYRKNHDLINSKEVEGINLKTFPSVNQPHKYDELKWGMAIDLNKCIGCGACAAACNIENNIPMVGKEQVKLNREMMWIRIDRYYTGDIDNPSISLQPVLCQHCDLAPCENVCPVAATTHSTDGINGMAYNRCVGTRYCSNNCPYKVRRFNFFDFRDNFKEGYLYSEPLKQLSNPEVTVRSRGVMEKCTFCLQRIMNARDNAVKENRKIEGTDVVTACQEACPTNAIIFGNINDTNSDLNKYRNHKLGYTLLEEIKVKPNITYIAKLRNNNQS